MKDVICINVLYNKIIMENTLHFVIQPFTISNSVTVRVHCEQRTIKRIRTCKLKPPSNFLALTHLILELQYCALGTFPKQ